MTEKQRRPRPEPKTIDGATVRLMVKAAVDKAGSAEKLAAKLDVTPSYISHILRGKKPGPKLCKHIGVVEVKDVWRVVR